MSVLTLNVDEVMRTLSAESANPFVTHDKEVDIVRFAINSGFADIVLDGQVALRVMYQRPRETEVRAQTLTYYDTDGLHNYYDWQLAQSDLAKNGSLMVALCILDISGGEVSEWHTTPCEVRVLSTIHTDDSDEGDDTITPTVIERVAVLETMIQRVASGAPIVVASTSAMTDTSQIYVLTTDGKWYYYDGSAWVAGGEYGGVAAGSITTDKLADGAVTAGKIASGVVPVVDSTLTQTGAAADAKVVGDELSDLKSAISNGADLTPIDFVNFNKYIATNVKTIDFTPKTTGGTGCKCVVVDCEEGDKFTINGTGAASTSGAARLWAFAEADGTRLSVAHGGITENNLVITAPTGAKKLVINNRVDDVPCYYGESVAVRMKSCEDRITTVETKNKYLIVPELELGNITFYDSGITPAYGSSTTRARTPKGYDLELLPGTVVGLTDYSGAEFYIGYYSVTAGKWVKNGWRTSDYVVSERGVYALLIRNTPEATITNIDTIKSLLRITATFDAQYNAELWTGEKENASKTEMMLKMMLKANKNIRTIGHRGWTTTAPENTIPSFKQARLNGCDYVETDIAFTSDGVAVLLHDTSINRTARNADGTSISETVNIADITYEEALEYDFGIWKGEEFAGTKIPTFEELLIFAKRTGLKIYAELKDTVSYTQEQVKNLVDSARKYGMQKNVSWISFLMNHIAKVLTEDSTAEVGFITNNFNETRQGLVTDKINAGVNIFVDSDCRYMTNPIVYCQQKGIPLDAWTFDSADDVLDASPIVRGFATNGINAASVLYDNEIES